MSVVYADVGSVVFHGGNKDSFNIIISMSTDGLGNYIVSGIDVSDNPISSVI